MSTSDSTLGNLRRITRSELFKLTAALAVGKAAVIVAVFLADPGYAFLYHFSTQWDSLNFETIAAQGYVQPYLYAFPPLYPALVHDLSYILEYQWVSGLVITNVLSFAFPLVFFRAFGFRAALFMELFPTYLVFTTIPYSDVVTLLFLSLSIALLMRGRILASSASASLAVFNIYSAACVLPSYAIELLKRRRARNLLFYVLPGVTGLLILLWYRVATGNYLGFFELEQSTWGIAAATPWDQARWLLDTNGQGWFTQEGWRIFGLPLTPVYWLARNLLFEVFYIIGAIYILKTKVENPLFLYTYSFSVIVPLFFVIGAPAVSVPRLLLPAFPVFVSYATLIKGKYAWFYYAAAISLAMWIGVVQTFSFFS